MHTKGRVVMSVAAVAALVTGLLYAGLADAAASGKVIGMTSGGGNKGYGVALMSPGLSGKRHHQVLTISTPISNVQCSEAHGSPIDCPAGATLTATLSNGSSSCTTFTTEASTWTGTGRITWDAPSSTGTAAVTTLKHYSLSFSPGVLYASERATAAGDGIKDGSETGIDAFSAPPGFSCASPGSLLTSLSLLGVLKITAP